MVQKYYGNVQYRIQDDDWLVPGLYVTFQKGQTMKAQGTQVLGQIIESLENSEVAYEDRELVYEILLEVFEEFEAKNLEECLDIDPAFDKVWNEKYPPEIEEYEE